VSIVIVAGFFVGIVYGLLATGLVLIYRGTRVINFAYGETGMIAAFVFNELWSDRHVSLALALVAALTLSGVIGAAIDVILVRPLRGASQLTVTVATFAVGALLLTFAGRRWGLNPRYTRPIVSGTAVRIGELGVQYEQLLILGLAAVVLATLYVVYRRTAFGLRLKATALDPYAAGLVGVDVDRTSTIVWALASMVAGLAAILVGSLTTFQVSFMTLFVLRAIAAALVGGLTSMAGAFGAGVLLGLVEAVIAFKAPIGGINEVSLAGFMLLLLVFRPRGLVRTAY
jgi:branched-subunit amino acid ABC-type transport system permease component